jgi:hypothetical protein
VPFIDTTSIIGGYSQIISDWQLGDGRVFSGQAQGLAATDNVLTDAYFTLKSSPNLPDADAIIQKHITPILSAAGQITGVPANILNVNVYSADYEGLVSVGPIYYWDFRVITAGGQVFTIATGTVEFGQNVTQTNNIGTPAIFPNNGQPRFRGFLPTHPKDISNFSGTFNQGDFFANALPVSGGPSGWVCVVACFDGSGFVTNGIVGDD